MGRANKRAMGRFSKPSMDHYLRKGYHKANKELEKETAKQVDIVFGAALLIFWEKYGWRNRKCEKIMRETGRAWDEVGQAGVSMSMLELAEKETGIEFALDGCYSYHTIDFLDSKLWDGNICSIFVIEVNQFLASKHDREWYLQECDRRGIKWLILEGIRKQESKGEENES